MIKKRAALIFNYFENVLQLNFNNFRAKAAVAPPLKEAQRSLEKASFLSIMMIITENDDY